MKLETDFVDRIEAICLEFPRYGYRRVTHQLKREGCQVNHKRVLRLMRESDLLCRIKRKHVRTTNSAHPFPRYPNLVKDMVVDRLNHVWLADITYIRIRTGFVYLAALLDACSQRVIGYAVSTRLDTALTLDALRMSVTERNPSPGSSTTQTRECSMPRASMSLSSPGMVLRPVWRGRATPMRMP